MSYTRQQFCTDVLTAIGNSAPSQQVIGWMVAWSLAETGHPTASYQGAAYNLLNTTQPATGATNFNSIGVKNYTSYAQGIQASAQTLQNGNYGALLAALQKNDTVALGFGAASPSSGVLANLHTWCGSCGYGNQFVTQAGQYANEQFTGTATGVTGVTPPVSATPGVVVPTPVGPINLSTLVSIKPLAKLAPSADVTTWLISLDDIMFVYNPFAIPTSTADPISFITEIGGIFAYDVLALVLRSLFLIIGFWMILRVLNEYIDYGALFERIGGMV